MTAAPQKLVRNEILIPTVILLLLLNLLFFPVIWGNKTLINSAGDAPSIMPYGAYEHNKQFTQLRRSNDDGAPAWFSEPAYALLHFDYFKKPVAPLWNPFNGFGAPLLANMQSQPFNPLVLIACLKPSPSSVDIFVLLRLLVAGILTNIYLRRFVGSYGAIFGAIAFMLTGYFMIFLNMPEISSSMYMPALFCTLELLAGSATFARTLGVAISTALVLLGGMPEVSFLILSQAGFYFLLRVANKQNTFKQSYQKMLAYIVASICGIALAAPQVFPFIEYVLSSSNTHIGGIGAGGVNGPGAVIHSNFPMHFLNYLTPIIYGPLGAAKVKPESSYVGFNGYWGVFVFTFALLAVLHVFSSWRWQRKKEQDESTEEPPKSRHERHLSVVSKQQKKDADDAAASSSKFIHSKFIAAPELIPIVAFFVMTMLFCLGKVFGFPLLNWVSALPLFKLVVFWKYSEPLMGFAMAVLAAIGFDSLANGKLSKLHLAGGFGAAAAILTTLALYDKHFIWGEHAVHALYDKVLLLALGLIVTGAVASFYALTKVNSRAKLCRLLIVLLCAELSSVFVLPQFYWLHQLAEKSADPYKGAPYVTYLQNQLKHQERVLGFDGVLFPNWSSAFQLRDIRNLDAILPSRYINFVRNFTTEDELEILADDNISNRFHGMESIADPLYSKVSKDRLSRLWYLSSVKYLLSTQNHFLPPPTDLMNELLKNPQSKNRDFFRLDAFNIDRTTRYVLYQHPTGDPARDTISVKVIVPQTESKLNFFIAMSPRSDGQIGDGMGFRVQVAKDGHPITVFEHFIEAITVYTDKKWFFESVDLSKFAGSEVSLQFTVDQGPAGNSNSDWGGWADVRFSDKADNSRAQASPENTTPKLVYNDEIQIYQTRDALPRAALFYDYKTAKDDVEMLKLLKSSSFDVSKSIVLDGTVVDQADKAIFPLPLENTPRCDAQTITSNSPLAVTIQVNAKHDGMLMLNDQFYPGWNVYVDGMPQEILRADYLFRAVPVKEGPHEVVFRYEPFSFYLGLWLCAFTLFALSAYRFFFGRKHH